MNIGIFITVRRGSTRLPQKALKEVKGKPIITYLISRMKAINGDLANIIICTTDLKEDSIFDDIAKEYGIDCYHGDANHIIKRHLTCANAYNIDFIVNIDGDDIFCNPEYVRKIIECVQINQDFDVIQTTNLPFGTNSMGYKKQVLNQILRVYEDIQNDTGWGSLITNKEMFRIMELHGLESEMSSVRLTLDYEEDYLLFKNVIENLSMDTKYIPQTEIISYLNEHPRIMQINRHLNEIYWKNFHTKKIGRER